MAYVVSIVSYEVASRSGLGSRYQYIPGGSVSASSNPSQNFTLVELELVSRKSL